MGKPGIYKSKTHTRMIRNGISKINLRWKLNSKLVKSQREEEKRQMSLKTLKHFTIAR